MVVFSIKSVFKTYQGKKEHVHTLKNINLTIKEKEFVCLIGPSGCGKSTLLQILAGLLPTSKGEVHFNDKPHKRPTRQIGVVFQDHSLFPWRTIEQNVGIGLELNGYKKKQRKGITDQYLAMTGLEDFAHKYPDQLSGGMKQRAGIARALVNNPDVLLMDEPFGALDHLTRLTMQEDLLRIWSSDKKTVVFVTHDVSEAVFLADRIVLLSPRPGEIKQIFDVKLERPRDRNDLRLVHLQREIYEAIHQTKKSIMPEYSI